MNKISKLVAFFISLMIIFIVSFLLFLNLIQITPNEKKIITKSNAINDKVEITYNSIGIPQIDAANINDLFFGIGNSQAENRIWQMDLFRRMAEGTLSEIFGERYITYDKFIRYFKLRNISNKQFSELPKDLVSILDSYTNGVNSFILENSENLALEFSVFNYTPELWKSEDCLMLFNFLNFAYNSSFKDNLFDFILQEKLTNQEYYDLIGIPSNKPIDDTLIFNKQNRKNSTKLKDLSRILDTISTFSHIFNSSYGNTFATRKQKEAGYQSIIANDFSSLLSVPSSVMLIVANSPEIKLMGAFIPGIPFCFAGKNNNISWAINFVNSNVWRFYEVRLNENKSLYYDKDSSLKKVNFIIDTIFVKNSYQRLYYSKFISDNGLFTDVVGDIDLNLVAVPPKNPMENKSFQAMYDINFAGKIEEIPHLQKKWQSPTVNIVYSDRNGNIGMTSLGSYYLYSKDSRSALTSTKSASWRNPQNKYVVSTNQFLDTTDRSVFVTNYRSKRIASFLTDLADFELRDIKNIQLDAKSEFAKELLNIIIPIIQDKAYLLNKKEMEVFDNLKNWVYSYSRNQKQPIIVEEFILEVLKNTLEDVLNSNVIYYFYNSYGFYERFIKILNNKYSGLFDDNRTPQIENRDYVIFTSAKRIFNKFSEKFDEKKGVTGLTWGRYNMLGFSHYAMNNKMIATTFKIDSFEINGHRTCVSSFWKNIATKKSFGISNRLIIDNQYDGIYSIISIGNSGDPTNDHFSDQFQVWKNGGYLKINYDKNTERATNKRIFSPNNK